MKAHPNHYLFVSRHGAQCQCAVSHSLFPLQSLLGFCCGCGCCLAAQVCCCHLSLHPSLPCHRLSLLLAQELATITHDRSFGQVIEAAIGSIGKATADATVPKITESLTMNLALFTKSIK